MLRLIWFDTLCKVHTVGFLVERLISWYITVFVFFLQRIDLFVSDIFPNLGPFAATYAFVCTWNRINHFAGPTNPMPVCIHLLYKPFPTYYYICHFESILANIWTLWAISLLLQCIQKSSDLQKFLEIFLNNWRSGWSGYTLIPNTYPRSLIWPRTVYQLVTVGSRNFCRSVNLESLAWHCGLFPLSCYTYFKIVFGRVPLLIWK